MTFSEEGLGLRPLLPAKGNEKSDPNSIHGLGGKVLCSKKAITALPPNSNSEGKVQNAETAHAHIPSEPNWGGKVIRANKAISALPSQPLQDEDSPRFLSEKASVPRPEISALIEYQVRRKFCISVVNKQVNAAKALVRLALGQNYTQSEEERAKSSARASRIVDAALSGKEQKPEDAELISAFAVDLFVVASSIAPIIEHRKRVELDMKKLARKLPVYPWVKSVHGLGELGLAVIVGEAGDLSNYPKKGHLWKRLGLMTLDGKAMSTWRKEGGLTADDWVAAGYSPRRRAEMYAVIGDPLFRAQSVVSGPYRQLYDRRRLHTAETHPDWTKAHSHNDAIRIMTTRLLRDLWREWRRADGISVS